MIHLNFISPQNYVTEQATHEDGCFWLSLRMIRHNVNPFHSQKITRSDSTHWQTRLPRSGLEQ